MHTSRRDQDVADSESCRTYSDSSASTDDPTCNRVLLVFMADDVAERNGRKQCGSGSIVSQVEN